MFSTEEVSAFISQVKDATEAAASALATTAENLWKIGIMKQYTDGIFDALVFLTLFGIALVMFLKRTSTFSAYKESIKGRDSYDTVPFPVIYFCYYTIIVISAVISFNYLQSAITHLLIPEYALIAEIMAHVQNKNMPW